MKAYANLNLSLPIVLFLKAEDGIGDDLVTGVQTCALPICSTFWPASALRTPRPRPESGTGRGADKIGRGAWRGRGEISVGAGSFKKKKIKLVVEPSRYTYTLNYYIYQIKTVFQAMSYVKWLIKQNK